MRNKEILQELVEYTFSFLARGEMRYQDCWGIVV